ncbi:MAG: hypothetical protein ACXW2F_06400, partial [Thermoanaerobaculia bacterium]
SVRATFCAVATETWRSSLEPPKSTITVMGGHSAVVIPSREDGEESGRRNAPPPRFLALCGARNDGP